MFDASQKSTGTGYTTTVALLAVALIFSPAGLIFYRPFGYMSLTLAIACSALCLGLAWLTWRRSSRLTIPSIANRSEGAK
jgi:asparagine N-glycosylation enzyme membrane subunit Stt3